jgi:hypothetical protein
MSLWMVLLNLAVDRLPWCSLRMLLTYQYLCGCNRWVAGNRRHCISSAAFRLALLLSAQTWYPSINKACA